MVEDFCAIFCFLSVALANGRRDISEIDWIGNDCASILSNSLGKSDQHCDQLSPGQFARLSAGEYLAFLQGFSSLGLLPCLHIIP